MANTELDTDELKYIRDMIQIIIKYADKAGVADELLAIELIFKLDKMIVERDTHG